MNFFYMILIGAAAGFIVEKIMKRDDSLWKNIVIGIGGSIIGGWVLGLLGIHIGNSLIGTLIQAVGGASLLLFAVNWFRNRNKS